MKTPPAARDLAIGVGVVVALSRFAPEPFAWPVAAFVLAATAIGALQIFAEVAPGAEAAGVPVESVILPGLVAGAAVLVARLFPVNVVLFLAVGVLGALILATLAAEGRIVRSSGPPSSADRTAIGVLLLVVGFLAFAGAAGLLSSSDEDPVGLAALSVVDGLVGLALGYRAAALRSSNLRDVAWFAVGAAIVMAIAAIALRSIDLPVLIGPALLVLVFFLWDAIHGGRPARRRDPWRAWEMGLLVVLAVAVVAWSFGLRP